MSVVLPAPLGPMSAWRAPRLSVSETSLVAVMPPKRITSPVAASTVSVSPLSMA